MSGKKNFFTYTNTYKVHSSGQGIAVVVVRVWKKMLQYKPATAGVLINDDMNFVCVLLSWRMLKTFLSCLQRG